MEGIHCDISYGRHPLIPEVTDEINEKGFTDIVENDEDMEIGKMCALTSKKQQETAKGHSVIMPRNPFQTEKPVIVDDEENRSETEESVTESNCTLPEANYTNTIAKEGILSKAGWKRRERTVMDSGIEEIQLKGRRAINGVAFYMDRDNADACIEAKMKAQTQA